MQIKDCIMPKPLSLSADAAHVHIAAHILIRLNLNAGHTFVFCSILPASCAHGRDATTWGKSKCHKPQGKGAPSNAQIKHDLRSKPYKHLAESLNCHHINSDKGHLML